MMLAIFGDVDTGDVPVNEVGSYENVSKRCFHHVECWLGA